MPIQESFDEALRRYRGLIGDRPNPEETWEKLHLRIRIDMQHFSRAFLWVVPSRLNPERPSEVYRLDPVTVSPHPEGWQVSNAEGTRVILDRDVRAFQTALSYGIKPPTPEPKTVFIELPEDATPDERDRLVECLSSRTIPGIKFAILPPGVRAVSPSRYGVREELDGYAYEVWGETQAEVMAMRAAVTGKEPAMAVVEPKRPSPASAILGPVTGREWRKLFPNTPSPESEKEYVDPGMVDILSDEGISRVMAMREYRGDAAKITSPSESPPPAISGGQLTHSQSSNARWTVEESSVLLHPDIQAAVAKHYSSQTEANWDKCWSGILKSQGIVPDGKPITPENLAATRKIMDKAAALTPQELATFTTQNPAYQTGDGAGLWVQPFLDSLTANDPQFLDKRICETCQHIASYPAPCCQDCVRCKKPTRKFRESDNAKILAAASEASRHADERDAEFNRHLAADTPLGEVLRTFRDLPPHQTPDESERPWFNHTASVKEAGDKIIHFKCRKKDRGITNADSIEIVVDPRSACGYPLPGTAANIDHAIPMDEIVTLHTPCGDFRAKTRYACGWLKMDSVGGYPAALLSPPRDFMNPSPKFEPLPAPTELASYGTWAGKLLSGLRENTPGTMSAERQAALEGGTNPSMKFELHDVPESKVGSIEVGSFAAVTREELRCTPDGCNWTRLDPSSRVPVHADGTPWQTKMFAVTRHSPNEWLEESSDQSTWTRVPADSVATLRYVRKCGKTERAEWMGEAEDTQPTAADEPAKINFREFL